MGYIMFLHYIFFISCIISSHSISSFFHTIYPYAYICIDDLTLLPSRATSAPTSYDDKNGHVVQDQWKHQHQQQEGYVDVDVDIDVDVDGDVDVEIDIEVDVDGDDVIIYDVVKNQCVG